MATTITRLRPTKTEDGYRITAFRLQLVREERIEGPAIRGPRDAAEWAGRYLEGAHREHFIALLLNTQHVPIGITTISTGTIDGSLVHPRELFKPAIAGNAAAVILAHNHPSGDPTPSPEDRDVTRKLRDAGVTIGIPVVDHVVIGEGGRYVSLVEAGLL